MKAMFWLCGLCALLMTGCELVGTTDKHVRTEPVKEDHSDIPDPRARWEAYELSDYTIRQTTTCFCPGPYSYDLVVRDGDVVDINNAEPHAGEGEINLEWYRTVDELFDLIEKEQARGAATLEVEYDARYGYPTDIFIDPDARIADEEIIITQSNLNQIVR